MLYRRVGLAELVEEELAPLMASSGLECNRCMCIKEDVAKDGVVDISVSYFLLDIGWDGLDFFCYIPGLNWPGLFHILSCRCSQAQPRCLLPQRSNLRSCKLGDL